MEKIVVELIALSIFPYLLFAMLHPELGEDRSLGSSSRWLALPQRLFSLRLLQTTAERCRSSDAQTRAESGQTGRRSEDSSGAGTGTPGPCQGPGGVPVGGLGKARTSLGTRPSSER
jgi:hypothetical protein